MCEFIAADFFFDLHCYFGSFCWLVDRLSLAFCYLATVERFDFLRRVMRHCSLTVDCYS